MSTDAVNCPGCGDPLRRSKTIDMEGERLKSCPECSGRFGRHVFYSTELFPAREVDGAEYLQSWCTPCRHDGTPERPAAFC